MADVQPCYQTSVPELTLNWLWPISYAETMNVLFCFLWFSLKWILSIHSHKWKTNTVNQFKTSLQNFMLLCGLFSARLVKGSFNISFVCILCVPFSMVANMGWHIWNVSVFLVIFFYSAFCNVTFSYIKTHPFQRTFLQILSNLAVKKDMTFVVQHFAHMQHSVFLPVCTQTC